MSYVTFIFQPSIHSHVSSNLALEAINPHPVIGASAKAHYTSRLSPVRVIHLLVLLWCHKFTPALINIHSLISSQCTLLYLLSFSSKRIIAPRSLVFIASLCRDMLHNRRKQVINEQVPGLAHSLASNLSVFLGGNFFFSTTSKLVIYGLYGEMLYNNPEHIWEIKWRSGSHLQKVIPLLLRGAL